MTIPRNARTLLFVAGFFALAGCGDANTGQGPAQQAGKAVDRAAEKTGEVLKEGAQKTGEAVQKAGEKIQDATTK
ncbi:MAG: hypothetical protein H0X38_11955 [Planctomycetes bacterium]|nr:hypothetical protein [Planctomycetota bacterium]